MRILLIPLLLAACSPPVAPPPPAAQVPPAGLAAVTTLAGEWKVAAIDGEDFNEPHGIALSADDREIWWAPRCAGLVRSYAIRGAQLRIGPALGAHRPRPGEPPPPVCAIGLPPRINEVSRAIDSATTVRRTPANGIELSGGGHSLLLFSQ